MDYFIKTPEKGYWLSADSIKLVEEKYEAKFMGPWCLKDRFGSWADKPVDLFFQPKPDTSKGHSHYFGIFFRDGKTYITNGSSAFEEPIVGIVTEDGEVIVSRYRHDCVIKDGFMIDGGRDYIRVNGKGKMVNVRVNLDQFIFEV